MRTNCLLCGLLVGCTLAFPRLAQAGAVNLGSVAVGTSAATLGAVAVLMQGAAELDFTNAGGGSCAAGTAYAANSSCTVKVTFKPQFPGTRLGAVVLTDSNGNTLATVYLYGSGQGSQTGFLPGIPSTVTLNSQVFPEQIAVDGSGNVFLIQSVNDSKSVVKETPSASGYIQSALGSGLASPNGIAVDGAGNVYIADTDEFRIIKETPSNGSYIQSTAISLPAGTYPSEPYGIAVDGSGNLYLTDVSNKRVLKETLTGTTYTQSTIPASGLNASYGIAVDGNGNVYIADTFNNRIVEETLSGAVYSQSTITSGLSYPYGVAVDGSGNVYIADTLNSRVLQQSPFDASVAQSAVGSELASPYGIALDGSGNLYIADSGNHRTLKENLANPPSLSFEATKEGATSSDSPQTVTVANLGNSALKFQTVSYPEDFREAGGDASDCTSNTSLSTGETCTLTVDFSPVTTFSSGGSTALGESIALTPETLNASSTALEVPVTGTEIASTPAATSPIFSPAAGTYSAAQSVTLSDATKGATIYYTTNGSKPTASSTKYTGAITVSASETIEAIAVTAGYSNSPAASATYTINLIAATPVFSVKAGTYPAAQSVTLTAATPNSTIYYTITGATPTVSSTKYTGAITVSANETINAISAATGYANSTVTSETYTLIGSPTALAAPATAVSTPTATLNAIVNTLGLTGSYVFQYGVSSTALTHSTTATTLNAATTSVAASAQLTGLTTKTTYYYQVVITTAGGTATGALLSFTTN